MTGLALTACALTLLVEALGAGAAFAYAAPVLLLLLPLLGGRYVGAERLERMTLRARGRRRRVPPLAAPAQTGRSAAPLPRGGRLIAFSLAVRPPPAAAL